MKKLLIATAILLASCSTPELGFKYVDYAYVNEQTLTYPYDGTGNKVLEGNPIVQQVNDKDYLITASSQIVDVVGVKTNGSLNDWRNKVYTRENFTVTHIDKNTVKIHWLNNEPVVMVFNLRIYY